MSICPSSSNVANAPKACFGSTEPNPRHEIHPDLGDNSSVHSGDDLCSNGDGPEVMNHNESILESQGMRRKDYGHDPEYRRCACFHWVTIVATVLVSNAEADLFSNHRVLPESRGVSIRYVTIIQEPIKPGPVFCLLLGVSSGCARPITGQVTLVTWPVIGWA